MASAPGTGTIEAMIKAVEVDESAPLEAIDDGDALAGVNVDVASVFDTVVVVDLGIGSVGIIDTPVGNVMAAGVGTGVATDGRVVIDVTGVVDQ